MPTDGIESEEPFHYFGQSKEDIPRNVAHVKVVDLSVKVIGEGVFWGCTQLRSVELCEGLERIDYCAFDGCESLASIAIPSTVKVIGKSAFSGCSQLKTVDLPPGLERIEDWAFNLCTSLQIIAVPSTVKVIGYGAFSGCIQLRNVELNEGLEWIDKWAFKYCKSLERISIPPTVKLIDEEAFEDCDSLETIKFCEEIEQFVKEAKLPWFKHRVSEASLRTYLFLARHNIPSRLGTIKVHKWKDNIYKILQHIVVIA
jgi:hypothetical protein